MSPTHDSPAAWPPLVRCVASLGLVVYLAAVVLPPLAGPPPASALAIAALQPLRPLVGALHLGHGYRFFAPDPGPGHSIRWRVTMPDGAIRTGSIPDPVADRPRLLYHRRFMVAEKIAGFVPPATAPADVRETARRDWQPLAGGVAANLLRETGGDRVALELVEHFLPSPEDVIAGTVEPDLVTPLGSYSRPGAPTP